MLESGVTAGGASTEAPNTQSTFGQITSSNTAGMFPIGQVSNVSNVSNVLFPIGQVSSVSNVPNVLYAHLWSDV